MWAMKYSTDINTIILSVTMFRIVRTLQFDPASCKNFFVLRKMSKSSSFYCPHPFFIVLNNEENFTERKVAHSKFTEEELVFLCLRSKPEFVFGGTWKIVNESFFQTFQAIFSCRATFKKIDASSVSIFSPKVF